MDNKLHWDDLRIVLAIHAAGSLAGAARRLNVSHATVFRRLGDIERRLGVKLFERERSGYTATVAGEELAATAADVETAVIEVERRVAGRDLRPSGRVCVTTTDTLQVGLLAPFFAAFQAAYPDIRLDIVVSSRVADLARREADIAIRPVNRPPETLVGRRIGRIEQAVYDQRERVDSAPAGDEARNCAWVGPEPRMGYRLLERWMAAQHLDAACACRVDSLLGMQAAVRTGSGRAVLPCYLADPDPGLCRVGEPVAELATDLWLLIHPDLRATTRIRAVMEFIGDRVRACMAPDDTGVG